MFALITKPTHITTTTASLIDNIFSNCVQNELNSGIICSDITDHMPVFCVNRGKLFNTDRRKETVFRRVITNEKIVHFKEELLKIYWHGVHNLNCANDSSQGGGGHSTMWLYTRATKKTRKNGTFCR